MATTTLADRIRAAMANVGINQAELERRAGFLEGYLSRPLAGARSQVAGDRLAKIARVCGVDAVWLATGDGEMRTASTPPPVITLDRTTADAPSPSDSETPLDRSIIHAWTAATMKDMSAYTIADMRNAQAAAGGVSRLAPEGTDLEATAQTYLKAARKVRKAGLVSRPGEVVLAIGYEAMAMLLPTRPDVTAQLTSDANARAKAMSDAFDAETPPTLRTNNAGEKLAKSIEGKIDEGHASQRKTATVSREDIAKAVETEREASATLRSERPTKKMGKPGAASVEPAPMKKGPRK